MISQPDVPHQQQQLMVVIGASIRSVTPLHGEIVTLVAATYVDGNVLWYRFELPMHKRVVREAAKEAQLYLHHLSESRLPYDAPYQAAGAALGGYTIEGIALGEDSNPKLDHATSIHGGVNMPTIVLDDVKLTRRSSGVENTPLFTYGLDSKPLELVEHPCGKEGCDRPATGEVWGELLYHTCDEHQAEIEALTEERPPSTGLGSGCVK